MSIKNNGLMKQITSKIMPGLDGNALTCAIVEPMWAIAAGIIFFYMPLYMEALGLSVLNMGFLNSFGAVLAAITSFIAGPITDLLGRKKTTLIFDLISWTGAMAVWAISRNFWFFVAAAVLNSFSKIPATSWTCLAIEDTSPDKRAVFFSLITIIGLGSGIFTPISGFLIDKYGTVATMRSLLALGCLSMTLMFFIRNHYTKETQIGAELMKLHSSISLKEKLYDYLDAMKYMFTHRITVIALIIVLLTNFQTAFQFFLVIYLKDHIGLSAGITSIIPGLSAFINLLIYFLFIPKMIKKRETNNLALGLALYVVGTGIFLFVSKGGYLLLFISTILTAGGSLITVTFRDTLWNNVIGEGERAKIFSACQCLIAIISIPSGLMAGYLYKEEPIYPFISSFIIFGISFLLSLYTIKLQKQLDNESNLSS